MFLLHNRLELVNQIDPAIFARYLLATGWSQLESDIDDVQYYQIATKYDQFNIDLPVSHSLSDYRESMCLAVWTLSQVENRDTQDVLLSLLYPSSDIIRLRLPGPDTQDGTMGIVDEARLLGGIENLLKTTTKDYMLSAGCDPLTSEEASVKLTFDCRIKQAETEDFYITLVFPFATAKKRYHYEHLDVFADPELCADCLTRNVLVRLMNNLFKIKKKIVEIEVGDKDSASAELKVDFDFFLAVEMIMSRSKNMILEIQPEWCRILDNKPGNPTSGRIVLTKEEMYGLPTPNSASSAK